MGKAKLAMTQHTLVANARTQEAVRKQKVLRIIGRLNVGGPAIHTVLLTDKLDPRRYETILVTGTEGETEGSMRYLAEERGITPFVIPEMGREISFREDLTALWKLIRLIQREKPDIIHTHTAKAGFLGRIAAICTGRRKRLYHTFHGHVFHSYFGERKTRAFIKIEQFLGRRTDRIIAVSDRTRDELLGYEIADAKKIIVVPLGLDLEPFARCEEHGDAFRRELGVSSDEILIGIVARLVPVKDIPNFLAAAKLVCTQIPNARFVIVGDGELRAALEAEARELSLGDCIIFAGYRRDLSRIYAGLDLVVLSSLNEGLPVSLIEAMSCAKVAISTSVGGVPNLLTEGETGFLCPPADSQALADKIVVAISQRDRWAEIGANARQYALSRYNIDRLVMDIERLYADTH